MSTTCLLNCIFHDFCKCSTEYIYLYRYIYVRTSKTSTGESTNRFRGKRALLGVHIFTVYQSLYTKSAELTLFRKPAVSTTSPSIQATSRIRSACYPMGVFEEVSTIFLLTNSASYSDDTPCLLFFKLKYCAPFLTAVLCSLPRPVRY